VKLAEWMSTERDVAAYHREIGLRCGVLAACGLACAGGVLPLWVLVLANVALYPGIYLRVHDIGHGVPVGRYGAVARFIPTANPIWGGTRVFAQIHQLHHSHFGTNQDPWLPYYTGHPLRALFFNGIEPEYSFAQFVKRRGWDRELASNALFHVALLVAGFALIPQVFAVHLVSQRVVHMTGIFFFNFYTHRETLSASASIGTWEREAQLRPVLPLLRLIWGSHVVEGLIFHNRHHCIGQTHIPVQHYRKLADTGRLSRFRDEWPIARIISLGSAAAALGERPTDVPDDPGSPLYGGGSR
jgi:hypothetical protein